MSRILTAVVTAIILLSLFSACSGRVPAGEPKTGETSEKTEQTTSDEKGGQTKMEEANRKTLAEALDMAEDDSRLLNILNRLDAIGAGQIQSAALIQDKKENALDLIAEDGTNYRVYLSLGGSVHGIKNMDTGEWPYMVIK